MVAKVLSFRIKQPTSKNISDLTFKEILVICYTFSSFILTSRSSHQRCSVKKMFSKISQNLQENTCARVSYLIKLQTVGKKETQTQMFSCDFCEILKYLFLQSTSSGCFWTSKRFCSIYLVR